LYIADLELCRYHSGPFDYNSWWVPLRAVGWLKHPQPFTRRTAPHKLLTKLRALVEQAHSAYGHLSFRGTMRCSFCTALGVASPGPVWSQENLFIPGKGVVYVSPGGIVHYMEAHTYLPPAEFVKAVLECPDLQSTEYQELLCNSNAGVNPPLRINSGSRDGLQAFLQKTNVA